MKSDFLHIYPKSKHNRDNSEYFMAKQSSGETVLVVSGADATLFEGVQTRIKDKLCKLCPQSSANSKIIRKLFDFTNPVSRKGHDITMGLGDRLGLACGGHISAIADTGIFPVLAQQSIRELTLTGRTYDDVLTAVVWAVFREGYKNGYAADGDHLKSGAEIEYALGSGFSMITLDCSEHIPSGTETGRPEDIYLPALHYIERIYNEYIKGTDIDFEISLDETQIPLSPEAHLYIARELRKRGVIFESLAPRFPGDFQKGIDYRGDIAQFERALAIHAKIADESGYKLSIHSGSDKFSVFPGIAKICGGKFHLKTAGTSWLEAVRLIAKVRPALYRQMHTFALSHLSEAKKYYHTTEDTSKIEDIRSVSDCDLPGYMEHEDARQVLHIAYGLILSAKTEDGPALFRDEIYKTLGEHDSEYAAALEKHIGRHLTALGIG
ncbi:MAG: tagaturonate epimerase family protein [Oscillospiraceae bacterium]|nr:tagaturonate epimerase family protein [Oscillospiraceae bacterium]